MLYRRVSFSALILCSLLAACPVAYAADTATSEAFKDIPASSEVLPAADYLRAKGIVQGIDGKFMPEKKLTRAEAAKILLAAQVTAEELASVKSSVYSDVQPESWYFGYVELARQKLKLDGPPKAVEFHPDSNVRKNEFIKMLLTAKKIDAVSSFGDLTLPLSSDVGDPDSWYYPYMRYAVAASMAAFVNDKYSPGEEITRGQMALLYYRLDMYQAGRRTQVLLSQTEKDVIELPRKLNQKDITGAGLMANRSIVAARGALAAKPNEPIVKGALKIAEGFRAVVLAYEANQRGEFDAVIERSKDAWTLAEKARQFSPGLGSVSLQMQATVKAMADAARKTQQESATVKE